MNTAAKKRITEGLLVSLRIAVAAILFGTALINFDRLTRLDVRGIVAAASGLTAAVAAVLGIYVLKSVLFVVPASIIYIYVGMAFETPAALLINLTGIIVEVTITFLLGKFLGGDYVEKKISGKKWSEKLASAKQKNKFSFLFFARLLPVFPIDFFSLFLGASGIRFLPYFLLSVAGIMPRVVLFTVLGDGIYDYIPMKLLVLAAVSSIPAILVIWLVSHFRKKNRAVAEDDESY